VKRNLSKKEIQRMAERFFTSLRKELGLPDSVAEKAKSTKPLLVKNLEGGPSFWIIPVVNRDRLVGFFRLGLGGELLSSGRYGQGERLSEFPPHFYLSLDMAKIEIKKAFGERYVNIEPPQLVHDGPIDRIAWLSKATDTNGQHMLLFWTFGTTYSRAEGVNTGYGIS
jgi:hypothetical protein